jgi:hypothetical protein
MHQSCIALSTDDTSTARFLTKYWLGTEKGRGTREGWMERKEGRY